MENTQLVRDVRAHLLHSKRFKQGLPSHHDVERLHRATGAQNSFSRLLKPSIKTLKTIMRQTQLNY